MNMLKYERSSSLYSDAQKVMPGGVNSPVRAFNAVGGRPVFAKAAKGAYIIDEDDNRYIDYINSWGPMILGHSYPSVVKAVQQKIERGLSFGMPTEIETHMAKMVLSMAPNLDKIRFVNSGTEACMSAIRLARGFTSKTKIIKFAGCYHGHHDAFLIQAGSGGATFGIPNSPGVTPGIAQDTLIAKFNDLESVRNLLLANLGQVACVIIEPVAGNMGCIPPQDDFLQELKELCEDHDALLIFDEVMTGFRLAPGGAQQLYRVAADIVCFGKILGGGMPVGAFASREEIMDHLAPSGKVYQAGTLSGNPVAMASGLATLNELKSNPEIYQSIDKKTAYLHLGIEKVLNSREIVHTINRVGSMFSIHFCNGRVKDFDTAIKGNNDTFKKFFHGMLERGIYIPPSAFESWFISDALTYEDLDETIAAVKQVAIELTLSPN